MKLKTRLIAIFTLILGLCAIFSPASLAVSTTQSFYMTENAAVAVEGVGEEKTLVFPEQPLNFESKVEWRVDFKTKITFTTKIKPYAKIFIVYPNGQSKEQATVTYSKDQSGVLNLKPGQQCRIQVGAGQFQNLFHKFGTNVEANCTYQKLQVIAGETSQTGGFQLDVYGPKNATQWIWQLPGRPQMTGPSIQTVFPTGWATIDLMNDEGKVKPFTFKLQIPDALEADPRLSNTSGFEEFTLEALANITSHYRSTTSCVWDFGDNTKPKEGTTVSYIYKHPGTYALRLSLKNSNGPNIEKTWQITVYPFEIINRANLSKARGGVPLKINYSSTAQVHGNPSHLTFLWDFGDGTTSQNSSGEHTYTRIGEYKITLIVMDDYHPRYEIKPWTQSVLAVPPILTAGARANPESGQYPLRVTFNSSPEVDGNAPDLEYTWNFGDGSTSNERYPSHTYSLPGIYKAKLIVRDRIYGTTTSDTLIINVLSPNLTSKSTLWPLFGQETLSINGQALVDNNPGVELKYSWYINQQFIASDPQLKYTLSKPGEYTVMVEITANSPGQTTRTTHSWQVTVAPPPDNHDRDNKDRDHERDKEKGKDSDKK
jgi:PKD repeat protein